VSARVERTIRVVGDRETAVKRVAYWRTRSAEDRLAETLLLHREGNDLFRGGNPAFAYVIEMRDVDDRQ